MARREQNRLRCRLDLRQRSPIFPRNRHPPIRGSLPIAIASVAAPANKWLPVHCSGPPGAPSWKNDQNLLLSSVLRKDVAHQNPAGRKMRVRLLLLHDRHQSAGKNYGISKFLFLLPAPKDATMEGILAKQHDAMTGEAVRICLTVAGSRPEAGFAPGRFRIAPPCRAVVPHRLRSDSSWRGWQGVAVPQRHFCRPRQSATASATRHGAVMHGTTVVATL